MGMNLQGGVCVVYNMGVCTCMCVCVCVCMCVCSMCVYTHMHMCMYLWASQVAVVVKNLPANARDARDCFNL